MSRRGSPLEEKPCRQCTSFSEYLKENKERLKAERKDESELKCKPEDIPRRTDCPLDKDELGNKTWGLLHTMAANYPDNPTSEDKNDVKQFFNVFSKLYPCEHCAADLREELKGDPPIVKDQEAFSQWLCRLHNKINVKTGKSEFDCSKVNERWRDGWKDGSCDY
ncbi:hypothetical protein ILUMI_10531 [Ignelater luminosus]|uniref:Sulfhydryl oxidase n=1 Tax=Ignelater luminosus TaxID=2038154 RepID=A0A8K0D3R0_IGNLU|nr:hypothetical protein ILUMI_10531 [Ignelater luminosus]